jgi:alpha-D-ribose 1-methylphosphonate 5-triphosphate synthase subunit PhnG
MTAAPANEQTSEMAERRRWMAVLARADAGALETAWHALPDKPAYRLLRKPETGLVMARGRIGGAGAPFNLGEIAVTRCAVQFADGGTGFSYIAGRDARKSELAALFDGLLQDASRRADLMTRLVLPLAAAQDRRKAETRTEAARTKVNFFALERREDAR